jgi:methylglyoxal synthase
VGRLLGGPLGGDFEIGGMTAEGKIDMLVFFRDNLIMQGHQNDVMGLVRLASLYNIPFATNRSTADFIISSPLYTDTEYERLIPNCIESYKNRKL